MALSCNSCVTMFTARNYEFPDGNMLYFMNFLGKKRWYALGKKSYPYQSLLKENSTVRLNKSDLLQETLRISSFFIVFFRLNNEAMTHAQGTTQVSERYVDIKARVMRVNLDCILKYNAIITLLNPINKADLITA